MTTPTHPRVEVAIDLGERSYPIWIGQHGFGSIFKHVDKSVHFTALWAVRTSDCL
jgi:hypothetical protein